MTTLTWLGQSCFLLESPGGRRILMDPIPDTIGYKPKPVPADVVTVSHEHFDHNNVALAQGRPDILRGLKPARGRFAGWERHDRHFGDVRIFNVPSFHDSCGGRERGLNSIFVFEIGGLRLAHLGDLGQPLDKDQIRAIGPVDVLLVPVGGFYTIDAAGAREVVRRLEPRRWVVPMHYRTDALTIAELSTADRFLEGWRTVERPKGNRLQLGRPLPETTEPAVAVLDYKSEDAAMEVS